MARPPIKVRPKLPSELPGKTNHQAITDNMAKKLDQIPVMPNADQAGLSVSKSKKTGPTARAQELDAVTTVPVRHASHDAVANMDLRTDTPADVSATPSGSLNDSDFAVVEDSTLQERHDQRMDWFYSEYARQAPNRRDMAIDEGFYDSKQWNREDDAEVRARDQTPVVYNEVKPTIDYLIGTERRSRVDFYVVAEDDDPNASDDAQNKTKLLKYLDDVNMAPFERSAAADSAFKAGLGILEVGLNGDPTKPPVFVGAESWRNFLHDSRAKRDQSDARYNFRMKELDLDIAIALFPQHADALKADATSGDSMGGFRNQRGIHGLGALDVMGDMIEGETKNLSGVVDLYNARERVMLIECWSREPVRRALTDEGLGNPMQFRVRVSIMTESITLTEQWSPFKHDRFPFILVWAYRDSATGMPYSPIRALRGPQTGLNRRMTRAQFEASFNQMELEKGAVDAETMDLMELQAEANDPTGMLIFADGALSGNRVRQRDNKGSASLQIELANGDRETLRAISSVNGENRGLQTQATSRVAMDAKAERGSIGTSELFDEQLRARQQEGEITLSLCEQFVTQPMTLRVAGESSKGRYSFSKINQQNPDGSISNDITQRRSHFVVGEQAWKQSYAESAFTSLMEVMTQLAAAAPQVVVNLLDVVFDMHPNLPNKRRVLERIRGINGQPDPDGKMTPEQEQAQQQKAQMAQAQFQAQMAQLQATIKETQAKGTKLDTDAVLQRVQALYEAAQAAQVLALAPGITPMADQILASAGFDDQSGSAETIQPDAATVAQGLEPKQQTVTSVQGRNQSLIGHSGGDIAPVAQPGQQPGQQPAPPMQPAQQAGGIRAGIQTMRPDGVR